MGTRMKKIAAGCAIIVMFLFMLHYSEKGVCAAQKDPPVYDDLREDEIQPDSDVPPEADNNVPPGTLFKKISRGMSMQHVIDLIGPPTDTKQYMTGKNFIPFYMGTDTVRLEALYKGQGRITFTGRPLRVYLIVNDPNESGYVQ
jgi:hypothetical protein